MRESEVILADVEKSLCHAQRGLFERLKLLKSPNIYWLESERKAEEKYAKCLLTMVNRWIDSIITFEQRRC